MAGTVRFQSAIQVEHGHFKFNWAEQFLLSQANRGMAAAVHRLTQTPENISYGELLGPGMVLLHNIGENGIVWGVQSGGGFHPVGYLSIGEFALFRIEPSVVLQAQCAINGLSILQPYILSA